MRARLKAVGTAYSSPGFFFFLMTDLVKFQLLNWLNSQRQEWLNSHCVCAVCNRKTGLNYTVKFFRLSSYEFLCRSVYRIY